MCDCRGPWAVAVGVAVLGIAVGIVAVIAVIVVTLWRKQKKRMRSIVEFY